MVRGRGRLLWDDHCASPVVTHSDKRVNGPAELFDMIRSCFWFVHDAAPHTQQQRRTQQHRKQNKTETRTLYIHTQTHTRTPPTHTNTHTNNPTPYTTSYIHKPNANAFPQFSLVVLLIILPHKQRNKRRTRTLFLRGSSSSSCCCSSSRRCGYQ